MDNIKHIIVIGASAGGFKEIREGHLYLAPVDRHMLVKPGVISTTRGPHENCWRLSIDVLFRSAAVAYSSSTIGIVLTGMLDDGTSGMSAIKRSGGIYNVDVDYRVHISDIGYVLQDIFAKTPVEREIPREEKVLLETQAENIKAPTWMSIRIMEERNQETRVRLRTATKLQIRSTNILNNLKFL